MKIKAFTLAEVLITLAIIGIVAAVTIPSVIANYQQSEFKTGLRKAVSVLNEAIQANIAIEGETPYENNGLPGYLMRHMSILKTGNFWSCYGQNNNSNKQSKPNSDNNGCSDNRSGGGVRNLVFYTTDGMRFEWLSSEEKYVLHESGQVNINRFFIGGQCGSYGLNNNPHNTIYPPCIIMVDVNGDRKPNPQIRVSDNSFIEEYSYPSPADKRLTDVFNILITEDRAIPYGVVAQRAMYEK